MFRWLAANVFIFLGIGVAIVATFIEADEPDAAIIAGVVLASVIVVVAVYADLSPSLGPLVMLLFYDYRLVPMAFTILVGTGTWVGTHHQDTERVDVVVVGLLFVFVSPFFAYEALRFSRSFGGDELYNSQMQAAGEWLGKIGDQVGHKGHWSPDSHPDGVFEVTLTPQTEPYRTLVELRLQRMSRRGRPTHEIWTTREWPTFPLGVCDPALPPDAQRLNPRGSQLRVELRTRRTLNVYASDSVGGHTDWFGKGQKYRLTAIFEDNAFKEIEIEI